MVPTDPSEAAVGVRILGPGDEAALERFLLDRADASMFLLSNLRGAGIEDHGAPYEGTYAAWMEGREIAAVVAHVWNRSLVLQAPRKVAELVHAAITRSRREVGGFVGPWEQVEAARRAVGLERAPTQYAQREDRFVVDVADMPVPEPLAEGRVRCRRARDDDLDLLARWRCEFAIESLGATDSPETRETYRQSVLRQATAVHLFVLEDAGAVVATTAFNAWAPPVAQVGGVWTPPEHRRRGYARAVVAGSLLDARSRGVHRAVLFTGNPHARRAYEAIGFRRVGDYGIVLLERPAAVEPR
jgi:predicted GNAT family acetyltransferase